MLRLTFALLVAAATPLAAQDILVQSTTSTQNSGLYDHLLPQFEAATGVAVRVVAVGTGQAIRNARNCDGDVLLVHAQAAEEAFVADGYGVARHPLMYNDFVIVGPAEDPAGVAGMTDAPAALRRIADARAPFVSRGDDSGTHKAERRLWAAADVAPQGDWYRETGSGMGAAINIAVGMGAYVLSDRATWASFGAKGDAAVLVEGDPALFNQYGVILVNPARCASVNAADGQRFVDWLVSSTGQQAIAAFELDGAPVFFPNADAAP